MEKRFLIFTLLAVALLIGNILVGQLLFPNQGANVAQPGAQRAAAPDAGKKPAAGKQPAGQGKEVEGDQAAGSKKQADDSGKTEPKVAETATPEVKPPGPDAKQPGPEVKPPGPKAKQPAKAAALSEKWVTLGSVDPGPDNPYCMLVTLTSKGAAVERLELASERFRDLEDRSGYLGHLAEVAPPGALNGALVRVVGDGTPAAKAGMKAGDVVTALDGKPIVDTDDLQRLLALTKPGQQVTVSVLRGGRKMGLAATLGRRPLEMIRPEIDNLRARKEKDTDQYLLPPRNAAGELQYRDPPSFLMTLEQIGDRELKDDHNELAGINLLQGNWELTKLMPDEAEFRRVLPDEGLQIIKRYRLAKVPVDQPDHGLPAAYHLWLDVAVRNTGEEPQKVAYRLDGPTGLPTEGWWYGNKISRSWGSIGVRDVVGWWEGQKPSTFSATSIVDDKVDPKKESSVMYLGVDAQYFSAVMIPQKSKLDDVWFAETRMVALTAEPERDMYKRLANVTMRMVSKPAKLKPGDEVQHTYQVFAGPKKPDLLAHYGQQVPGPNGAGPHIEYSLSELVYYGWFSWVAKAMLGILHAFYAVVRNYGISIIMLTVLVRASMFPLSRKQALNMAKMQQLQPEIKKIHEKYKKDMEKRTKAQQELFRKHSYNPMGGCMLMFLQLPIFIGLYRSLMVDVELRQAPLISDAIRWCSNLAAPDMLFDWSGFMPEFITRPIGMLGLGPYFNVLPIVTVALFLAQQKMFMPPAVDEQAAMQQKIMKYMMVFIGIMFYKVASGLCLYFIASTLWGMAERKLLPKITPPGAVGAGDAGAKKKPGKADEGAPAGGRVTAGAPSGNGGAASTRGKRRQKKK